MKLRHFALISIIFLAIAGCSTSSPSGTDDGGSNNGDSGNGGTSNGDETLSFTLKDVRFFMYQLQGLNEDGAIDALASTHYDMIVVEPTATVTGEEDFDMAGMVTTLKSSKGSTGENKLIFAYVDVGEAEDYRSYWGSSWTAPSRVSCGHPGNPSFMLRMDPDGWSGNYPVAYWDEQWVAIMEDVFTQITEAGFDGAYLDWIEAYDDDCVIAKAEADGKDPATEMVNFVEHLKAFARTINPNFMIISQNAPYLAVDKPYYLDIIDGLGVEDTFFGGDADTTWGDPNCCDIPNTYSGDWATDELILIYENTYIANGIPVFSIDYAVQQTNIDLAYSRAASIGMIPLVTDVSLAGITNSPPPGY